MACLQSASGGTVNRIVIGGVTGGLGRSVVKLSGAACGREWCDLTDDKSVAGFAETLGNFVGTEIHILNLAGKTKSSMLHKSNYWNELIEVNLLGNERLLRHLRPIFKARPVSTFTMVGSVTSALGTVGTGMYSATKSALEGLTRVAAHEFAPFARVNLLQLGYCDCGMIAAVPNQAELIERIPMKRLGTAADVLAAWEFFINCKYVTGAIVPVNGGLI